MSDASASMQAYYARRAPSYDRVYFKPERQADLRAIEGWIPGPFAGRRVLEVACGTGWWTRHAARDARDWLATDLNPETLAIARTRAMPPAVRFAIADADALDRLGESGFDAAFAGFWWSHVPWPRQARWLESLHLLLAPGARVVLLDNRFVKGSSTPIARTDADGNTWQLRRLDDGSAHEVLKNFPTREQAFSQLGSRAVRREWIEHEHYWILDYRLA